MRRGALVWLALGVVACSDPPPSTSVAPTSATVEGIRVRVGGREVVVHCPLTCPAAEAELTRLSSDCLSSPASGPHRVATGGALLTLGCCEEATVALDRACGREGLPGCAAAWAARCESVQAPERPIEEGDRGVSSDRGIGR